MSQEQDAKITSKDFEKHSEEADKLYKLLSTAIRDFMSFEGVDIKDLSNKDVIVRSDIVSGMLTNFSSFVVASTLQTYAENAEQREKLLQEVCDKYRQELANATRQKIQEIQAMQKPSH